MCLTSVYHFSLTVQCDRTSVVNFQTKLSTPLPCKDEGGENVTEKTRHSYNLESVKTIWHVPKVQEESLFSLFIKKSHWSHLSRQVIGSDSSPLHMARCFSCSMLDISKDFDKCVTELSSLL